MNVFINNNSINCSEETTLHQLLHTQGITSSKGIAVAINNSVIPKADWEQKKLTNNDKITIIRATQGG